jgi:hypothetical protein
MRPRLSVIVSIATVFVSTLVVSSVEAKPEGR